MRLVLLIALAGCLTIPAAFGAGGRPPATLSCAELYVAPDGDDRGAGTIEAPFATLERARDAVRELEGDGLPAGGVIVRLRAGTYVIGDSFALSTEDSGTQEARITYCAHEGEWVRLVGGKELDGPWSSKSRWFAPVEDRAILDRVISEDARGKLLYVNLRERGISDYGRLSRRGFSGDEHEVAQMELFIDGERMTLARWPNDDFVHMVEVLDEGPTDHDDPAFWQRGGRFRYDFDRPALWTRADDIWLDGVFSEPWVWSHNKIAEIDAEKQTITLRYGDGDGMSKFDWVVNDYFFAENLLEEIDVPGEYYLDRKSGVLYLLPPESFGPDSYIAVSMLKVPMVTLEDVSHVTIRDLVLELGRGNAVVIDGGEGVRFENCEIRNFAGDGVYVNGTRHAIVNSRLHHLGGSAVELSGGDLESLSPAENVVENCNIHDFSYLRKVYHPAVSVYGVGQQIRNCLIYNGPHMAIQVGGNDHVIEYNEFHHVPTTVSDMGVIYIYTGGSPHHRGTVIRRNYFHDTGAEGTRGSDAGGINGVYPDDETFGVTIDENIFYRMGRQDGDNAILLNGAAHIRTRNNIFVDCITPYTLSFRLNGYAKDSVPRRMAQWRRVFEKYDFANMPHGRRYPELLRFFEENRIAPDTNTFERNLIYNPTRERTIEGGWQVHDGVFDDDDRPTYPDVEHRLQASDNWVAEEAPGFVDLAGGDFRLRENAPVFERIPGFVDIPFDEIGLKNESPVGPRALR